MDLHIDDISLKEYKILECPSRSSSFVAEAKNKYGIHAIGCDPLFGKDLETSIERGETDIDYIMQRVSCTRNLYKWGLLFVCKRHEEYRTQAILCEPT
jgi:hypothetical protein